MPVSIDDYLNKKLAEINQKSGIEEIPQNTGVQVSAPNNFLNEIRKVGTQQRLETLGEYSRLLDAQAAEKKWLEDQQVWAQQKQDGYIVSPTPPVQPDNSLLFPVDRAILNTMSKKIVAVPDKAHLKDLSAEAQEELEEYQNNNQNAYNLIQESRFLANLTDINNAKAVIDEKLYEENPEIRYASEAIIYHHNRLENFCFNTNNKTNIVNQEKEDRERTSAPIASELYKISPEAAELYLKILDEKMQHLTHYKDASALWFGRPEMTDETNKEILRLKIIYLTILSDLAKHADHQEKSKVAKILDRATESPIVNAKLGKSFIARLLGGEAQSAVAVKDLRDTFQKSPFYGKG